MMNEELSWERLHDATLVGLECSWESGDVTLRLRTGLPATPRVDIRGLAGRLLLCPRRHPWGPSISVNEVRKPTRSSDNTGWRLEIEMQSGDTIVVEAGEFQLAVPSTPFPDSQNRG